MGLSMTKERLNLSDLKAKSPADLLAMAEEWEIENASTMRKGEMMFSILKEHAEEEIEIGGDGVGIFAAGAGGVRVVEAQDEGAAGAPGDQRIEERGAGIAHMDQAGGRRREAQHGRGGARERG